MNYQEIENQPYLDRVHEVIFEKDWSGFEVGKVITQHRDHYLVKSGEHEYRSQVLGQLLFETQNKNDLPVVGDWVCFQPFEDQGIIHGILPRKNTVSREKGNLTTETQTMASNVDGGLIIMGADRDFNPNRAERYLSLCFANNLDPILVISKADTVEDSEYNRIVDELQNRLPDVTFFMIDSITGRGLAGLREQLTPYHTFALMGSSGAGKSTLLNALMGQEKMKTGAISDHVNKGKHTTTHRELVALPNGAFIIDNPGMRSVGVGASGKGMEQTFNIIEELANECRFDDCTHTNEPGCMVIEGLKSGKVLKKSYENYQKLIREAAHHESSEFERRKKGKSLARLIKKHKRDH